MGDLYWTKTLEAGEDLDDSGNAGHQYHAIAFDDGKLAAGGNEAGGILLTPKKSGEHITIGVMGELPFRAGGAIADGGPITVTTSGWMVTCGSGYYIVGRAMGAVTSGSIGKGLFNFALPVYANTSDFIGLS